MAKAKTVSVQGFAGQQPLNKKSTQIGVAGFDHATIDANKVVDSTLEFLNGEVAHAENRGQKLKGIIKAISTLTHEGHEIYRRKLATVRELAKGADDGGKTDAELMGYSVASFTVMISNFAALSKAFQAGWAYNEKLGWVESLKIARGYSKAQAMAKGEKGETKGRKVRVEMPVIDKIMALIGELDDEEMVEFTEKLTSTYTIKGL